jgi:hypothetical protein
MKKRYTRLADASDKVNQLLAHGRWFSPDTPASSTTKTGRHSWNIAESGVKHNKSNQINQRLSFFCFYLWHFSENLNVIHNLLYLYTLLYYSKEQIVYMCLLKCIRIISIIASNSIQLLTGSEDNSCCSRNQSITDLLYLIILNAFYFNFFSCF